MQKLTLALVAASMTFASLAAEEASQFPWQTGPVSKLKKIDLGTWSFADDINPDDQWVDDLGNKKTHNYPSCYQLDLSGEGDITIGRGYILKDIAPMFGSTGLLQDKRNNLDRLMSSPLMTGTEIVHEATGGPVEVDFMFGAGNFGNRLCYYYAPAEVTVDKDPRALVKAFAENEIPTFCIDPQMRASKHMERWKKDSQTGEWKKLDKNVDHFDNDHLGRVLALGPDTNYGSWGDDLITGRRFRLKYFGAGYDQEPTDNFPAGTRIYFFLVTYNDGNWDGELDKNGQWKDSRLPYSVKFASRTLNTEFGTQGNWWKIDNHREYGEKYGSGAMAASAINYWYADSNTGQPVNLNMISWEDRIQPESDGNGTYTANSDYDMGDVAFALYGVKNPITDIDEADPLRLRVDPWSDYAPTDNTNHYTHWLNIVNEGGAPVRSCDLQPVTFSDGRLLPAYTWVSISQYEDGGDAARPLKFLVIRKSARLDGKNDGEYQAADLVNENLRIKLDYAYVDSYGQDLAGVEFKSVQNEFTRGINDETAVDFGNLYYKYEQDTEATGSHPWKYGYQMSFSLNGGKIRNTNIDTVMIPRSEIIVDPRGTAEDIDFAGTEEKHFTGTLPEIKNRMYVTVRCADLTDLDTKEDIKAVMLCGTDRLSHYKDGSAPSIGNNILCILTKGDDNNWAVSSQNGNYQLAGMSAHDDAQWLVLEADLVPSDVHAVIYTQCEDKKNKQIDNNFYGIAPKGCTLPALDFKVDDLRYEGVPHDKDYYAAIFPARTSWSVEGFDNNSGILFNQWRAYNNGFFKWNDDESAYLNILHGTEPRSGSMPADRYTAWLGYDTHTNTTNVTNNELTFDNGRWTNLDVLAQPYENERQVTADYLLRAYYVPQAPTNLPLTRAAANRYVVLEAGQQASARQNEWTGIEDAAADSATGEPVYYNLQGMRTAAPQAGQTYIVVRGTVASKEVYRR